MSMEEVEVQMQRCKAEGRSPFSVDGEFLARHQPGLVLTQDTCQSCDPTTAQVLQVCSRLCCPAFIHPGNHTQLRVSAVDPKVM